MINNDFDFSYDYDNFEALNYKFNKISENYIVTIFPPLFYSVIRGEVIIKTLSIYHPFLIILLKMHRPFYYRQLIDITAVDYTKKKKSF